VPCSCPPRGGGWRRWVGHRTFKAFESRVAARTPSFFSGSECVWGEAGHSHVPHGAAAAPVFGLCQARRAGQRPEGTGEAPGGPREAPATEELDSPPRSAGGAGGGSSCTQQRSRAQRGRKSRVTLQAQGLFRRPGAFASWRGLYATWRCNVTGDFRSHASEDGASAFFVRPKGGGRSRRDPRRIGRRGVTGDAAQPRTGRAAPARGLRRRSRATPQRGAGGGGKRTKRRRPGAVQLAMLRSRPHRITERGAPPPTAAN
jgi:hypothetical protein